MKKLLIMVTLLLISVPGYSDTDSSLKNMMSSAATRAGGALTFTDPSMISKGDIGGFNRTALDLGGLRFRTPVESFNLVSFQKPNISAGCNGIDITLGSFSFLSKDELIAMFRSIASNALTYAFGTAIKNMCPDCWSLMNSLQDKMQDLNQMFSNTCATAKCLLEDGCRTEGIGNMACVFSTGYINSSDYSDCKDNAKEEGETAKEVALMKANEASGEKIPFMMGNMTIEMIKSDMPDLETKLDAFNELLGLGLSSNELILSILGTIIIDDSGDVGAPIEGILDFNDLFQNSGDEINPGDLTTQVLKCEGDDDYGTSTTFVCVKVASTDLKRTAVKVDQFIESKLTNLVNALNTFTDVSLTSLTPMETYLLNYIEKHLVNAMLLGRLEKDSEVAASLIKAKGPYIADQLKVDLSTSIINLAKIMVVKGNQNKSTTLSSQYLSARIKELAGQRDGIMQKSQYDPFAAKNEKSWLDLKDRYSISISKKIADIASKR